MDTLLLRGDFSIVAAEAWRERLLGWLADRTDLDAAVPLRLDLSAIDGFDSAGVQLLLALRHSVAARGGELQLLHAPAQVREALATLGLSPLLQRHATEAADVDA